MKVKYFACTSSVWEGTRCCRGELREHFSITEKTDDPGPYLPCRRRPHISSAQTKEQRTKANGDPRLATDKICERQSPLKCNFILGHLGGSAGWGSDFGPGHDLMARGFEPCLGLCADSSEPGAYFRFCVSLALCPSHSVSVSVSLKNKH